MVEFDEFRKMLENPEPLGDIECKFCHKKFTPVNWRQKFCTPQCGKKWGIANLTPEEKEKRKEYLKQLHEKYRRKG